MHVTAVSVWFNVAALLEKRGMSQRKLAVESGVSLVTVHAIVNNDTTRVDLATLDKLCDALKVTPGDLLYRGTKPPKRDGAKEPAKRRR